MLSAAVNGKPKCDSAQRISTHVVLFFAVCTRGTEDFCSSLCTLRLRGCTSVTDAGVALLTSKCGSALRQLDLAQCGWGSTVSDLAVYAVPQQ